METTHIDNYYHESGHAVTAKLFEDVFKTRFVTMDQEYSKQLDSASVAGLNGGRVDANRGKLYSVEEANKIVLIFIAGFCMDLLYRNKNAPSKSLARQYIRNEFNPKGEYSGDRDYAEYFYNNVIRFKTGYALVDYLAISTHHLCGVLVIDEVWNMATVIRNELKNVPNQTLTGEQLEVLFDNYGFSEWLLKQGNLIEGQERSCFAGGIILK